MNLTDAETVKALECHIKRQCWNDCPNATEERQLLNRPCSSMIAEDALDLINRKQAVNELQAKQIVDLKIKVKEQKAEIESLQKEKESIKYCYEQSKEYNNKLAESCEKNCKKFNMTTRAEAVKEFAERLIHEIVNRPSEIQSTSVEYLHGSAYRQNEIVDLVKELVGEE